MRATIAPMKKKRKHIELVPNVSIPCFRTWCGKCRTMVKVCRENDGKPLSECTHIGQLSYRYVSFIPGTRQRIVRDLGKSFPQAMKKAAALREQLDNGEFSPADADETKPLAKQEPVKIVQQNATAKPTLLIHVLARHIAFLKNQGVPPHLKVERSAAHIKDVHNCYKKLCTALKHAGHDLKEYPFASIDDAAIGVFYQFLQDKKFAPRTKNKFFSYLSSLSSWAEEENYGDVRKFIDRVPRNAIEKHPAFISQDEFKKLLSVITPENGRVVVGNKRPENKQRYFDFLIPSFTFGAITGRRTEELITCTWKNVHTDEHGEPLLIEFTDWKASRIKHLPKGSELKVFSPATTEVKAFLYAQGFKEKCGTNEYILAPALTKNRVAFIKRALSNGFSHFWNIAFPDGEKHCTFGNLRDSYMTALKRHMKGDIRSISGHASEQVIDHYLDKREIVASLAKDFNVYEQDIKVKRKQRTKDRTIER